MIKACGNDSEKWTEVTAVLCINSGKEKDCLEEKIIYIKLKEVNVSIRRKNYPVCEDAESKGPLPVPVNAEFFSEYSHNICLQSICLQKVSGIRHSTVLYRRLQNTREFTNVIFVLGRENQDLNFRLQGSGLSSPKFRTLSSKPRI